MGQEHRDRQQLKQEEKEAWPRVTHNFVAEARAAKDMEAARLRVKAADANLRRVREALYQTMISEEGRRSELWDEQLQVCNGLCGVVYPPFLGSFAQHTPSDDELRITEFPHES